MKKTLLSILVTILSVVFINAQDLGLNEILKKHRTFCLIADADFLFQSKT